jgi:hypothetical protein
MWTYLDENGVYNFYQHGFDGEPWGILTLVGKNKLKNIDTTPQSAISKRLEMESSMSEIPIGGLVNVISSFYPYDIPVTGKINLRGFMIADGSTIPAGAHPSLVGKTLPTYVLGGTLQEEVFTLSVAGTTVTLAKAPLNSTSLWIAVGGVLQNKDSITISGSQIIFPETLPIGTNVSVKYIGSDSITLMRVR